MRTQIDVALVRAAQAGDAEALAEVLAAHLPLVYNVVGRALHGHADVDDVVQETMLRAVQRLGTLRDPERIGGWLAAVALRQVQEWQRAHVAGQARAGEWDDTLDPPDQGRDFVDDLVARHRLTGEQRNLVEASRWLGAEDRRVLALWWQEAAGALSRAEVADALELSVAHTGVRVQRMRAQLTRVREVLAAWRADPRCAALTEAARGWAGETEPRWLKRLHRHVRDCPVCLAAGRAAAPDRDLLAGIGLLPVPVALTQLLPQLPGLSAGSAGSAAVGGGLAHLFTVRRVLAVVAGAGTAAVTAAVLLVPSPPEQPPLAAPPPAAPSAVPVLPAASTAPASSSAPPRTTIHLAPTGSDAGDGSAERPYATLGKAVAEVRPGQTIVAHGGVYKPTAPVEITTSGTPDQRITLTAGDGERPVFDAAAVPADKWFVTHEAGYWTVRGLEIRNARNHPYVCMSCRNDVFQRLSMHDNQQTGLMLRGPGTIGNQVLDSDFFDNHDASGGAADGLAFKYGAGTGNVVRGCRMNGNVGDGLDLQEFTDPVTVDRSWAYDNGVDHWADPAIRVTGAGNGFRLGGGDPAPAVAHVVTNSAAWDNAGYGFTESANRGSLRLTNNTAFRNAKDGFAFFFSASTFQRNLALSNQREAVLAETAVEDGNSWNQSGWTPESLGSTDPKTAKGPRQPDGSLPKTSFLANVRNTAVGAPMPKTG